MRITNKVFHDLAIFMAGFGLLIGIVFPFFMLIMSVPSEYVMTPLFFLCCISAGILVGAINYLLSRVIVGGRLRFLAHKMSYISEKLGSSMNSKQLEECSESCLIDEYSEDEIGESASAFNALVHSLSHSLRSEQVIKSFSASLSNQMEVDSISLKALDNLVDYLGASGGAVLMETGGDLEVVASYAIAEPQRLCQADVVWKALKKRQRFISDVEPSLTITHALVDFTPRQILIEPLVYKGSSQGVVVLALNQRFSSESEYGFSMCLENLTLALRNAVTYEQLQKLAANDPLTGIYNRRFGLMRLKEEFSRALRVQVPIGVLMFDIDHFKSVNDTYGHTVGDKIIVSVARIAKAALREGDILLRYGGEEFLIIMPGASIHDSEFVAQRVRRMIEEAKTTAGGQQIGVTVSIGAASFPETDVEDEMQLVTQADTALYEAKHSGRNCVVCR